MIEWPEPLKQDLARRRTVLYLGSGISANATSADGAQHPPVWEAFLRDCVPKLDGDTTHIVKAIDERQYLDACEWIRRRLDDRWIPTLREAFVEPRYKSAAIHQHIFDLDARFVLTPNFDKIYDGHAESESDGTTIVKSYSDPDLADLFRINARTVLKVHGSIDSPTAMIFTHSDYASARIHHAQFYRILDALVLTHTFLFLGCGISDPDIQLFLEHYRYAHKPSLPHYITLPTPIHDDLRYSLREQLNLKTLAYDPASGHTELAESLKSLAVEVDAIRATIADAQTW